MGFKNRIGVLLKSQFNYWIRQAEDPEKIIDQAVEEMEEGLERARARLAGLRFRVDEEEKLLQRIEEQISWWRGKAEELLEKDMEENAKDAVRRRRVLEEEERKLKVRHAEDEVKLKEMESALRDLEARVQTAKSKRNILVKNVSLRKGAAKGTGGVGGYRGINIEEQPFSVFRKMEERVEEEREFSPPRQERQKEAWEQEEKLIQEEIETLKRNIKKGGSKK